MKPARLYLYWEGMLLADPDVVEVSGLLYSCFVLPIYVLNCPSKGDLHVGQTREVRGSDHHLGLFSAPVRKESIYVNMS